MRRLVALVLLLLCCDGLSEAEVAPMDSVEQEALYSVIQGFVGEWWNGSGLYPDPCGWTPIQGVSCDIFDGLWYITVLNIGPVLENSLECAEDAKFNPSLFKFKQLKSLSFFNCFSSDQPTTIPAKGWEMLARSLETLEFRSNRGLIGQIPARLGRLTNLESLVLAENALTGLLPQELGNLLHLKRLTLSGNGLYGRIPSSLGNLNQLLILDLSRNSFNGPIPPSLGGLKSLLKLDLSNNIFKGKLPTELGKLTNLTLLDLRSNNFTGGLTQSLESMVSLQDMLLSNNPLGGNLMPIRWENLVALTNLDLSNNGFNGEIPKSITKLRKLRFIALDNNYLSGIVPRELAGLPVLSALYLSDNNLTGGLEFSSEFYERLGRRFAIWHNPSLCYSAGLVSDVQVPSGVKKCKEEVEVPNIESNSVKKMDSDLRFISSFGLSSSLMNGFWWAVFAQELVVVVLLVLLL